MDGAFAWIGDNGTLLGVLGIVGLVSLLATVILLPFLIVRIPPDHFCHRRRRHPGTRERHPLARHAMSVSRNLLGGVLILAGIAMLVLPGQGLLTLLVGLTLTDFPGKYALEKWILGQPGVLGALNWLRRRAGRPPLLAPAEGD